MLKTECIEVEHTQMQLFIIHSGSNIHSYKHSFDMFITFINRKCDCRSKIDKITYLIKNSFRNQLRRCNVPPNHRPVCSLISQQRCHPRAGHDSPRNSEQAGLHIAKDTQNIAKTTQLGLSSPLGVGKGSMLSWRAHYKAKNTYTRTSLSSKTPAHTQHKESVPSLLHSPSGLAFPSSALQGLWRRKPAL